MPFNQPGLKMLKLGSTYAVATATVTWTGSKIDWKVKNTDPIPLDPNALPVGRPFWVSAWKGSAPNFTADLSFATNITNVDKWHKDVFDPCRGVKVLMSAAGQADRGLIIGLQCASDPRQLPLLALVDHVVTLVGSAVLLILQWPLQFFRRKPTVEVQKDAGDEDEEASLDRGTPLQTTPPPAEEEDSPSGTKRGAA